MLARVINMPQNILIGGGGRSGLISIFWQEAFSNQDSEATQAMSYVELLKMLRVLSQERGGGKSFT